MSCDAIALSAMLWLASASPEAAPPPTPAVASAPTSVAQEPLFADIVVRAGVLKSQVEAWKGVTGDLPGFDAFKGKLGELAELDLQGHKLLAARGTDGDLKCILRGISQDLPVRLKDVETAADAKARDNALREMGWLLRDNVEVITTPPTATSGTSGA
ncbi:MAG: hypothetical protein V4466_03205 [Pseudomonadota bacterium]